LSFLVLFLQQR